MAVGGEWFLQRKNGNEQNLLLVAGGVGINPILSMLRHLVVDEDSWQNLQEKIVKFIKIFILKY